MFTGSPNITTDGTALILGATGSTGQLQLIGGTSGSTTLLPAAVAGSWAMTLPGYAGSAGQYLTSVDGTGATSWSSPITSGSAAITVASGLGATPPSTTVYWSVVGTIATLNFSSLTGVGNGNAYTVTGFPNNVKPIRAQTFAVGIQNYDIGSSSAIYLMGFAILDSSGVLTVSVDPSGTNFETGQVVGLFSNTTLTYGLT